MIKENQIVRIKINKRTKEHYSNLGYDINDKQINIDAKNLHYSSKNKILTTCDVCQEENNICFVSYIRNIERGGFYTCIKCKDIKSKKTHMEKYGKFFNNREKSKLTNLEKYGCENVSSSQIIKDKKKETCLKNWGVENSTQSNLVLNKMKQTVLERYGVEHVLQNKELLKKSMDTCFKNNGVEYPTKLKKVIDKRIENNLLKYGKEHYTQTEQYKSDVEKSNNLKYGAKWYMSSKDFKNKSKITNLERYGVEYNMQNEEIFTKAQISGFKAKIHEKTNLIYRGNNEKDFLDFCFENKINVEKGKRFSYFFDGLTRYYFSDYFLFEKNLIIEIKSSYYYKKYYDKNISKMDSAIKNGYDFIFIIDKKYDDFKLRIDS